MTEQHFPTHGGSYIVGKDGIIRTEAEAEAAKASKILPEPALQSTESAPASTKSKGI